MANAGAHPAGLPDPEPPSLDHALWTAAPKQTLGERVAGITGSVLAHLVVAGGLLAVAMFAPAREQPGLTEIPVEIVVEAPALASAEPESPGNEALKEPASLLPAANAPGAGEALDEDATRSETEQALLPGITQEAEPPDSREATEVSVATIPVPGEQSPEALVAPVIQPTVPSGPSPQPRQPAADKSSPEKAKRNLPKQAIPASGANLKRVPAREEARVARQPDEAVRRSPGDGRSARALRPAKDAVHGARGMMPRMARVGDATSAAEHGSRAEAAASPAAAASYRSQVIAHLTRFKRYPLGAETRGAEGTPVVSFSLDSGGRVASVALARSSGHSDIDAETLAMVRRAVPFPAPPAGAPQAISAAISFQLR